MACIVMAYIVMPGLTGFDAGGVQQRAECHARRPRGPSGSFFSEHADGGRRRGCGRDREGVAIGRVPTGGAAFRHWEGPDGGRRL